MGRYPGLTKCCVYTVHTAPIIEKFKTRLRLGTEPDRTPLLAQLKGILSAEELENYGAALARRPVVANRPQFALNGEVVRFGDQIIDVARPAVLVEKPFAVGGTFR